MISLFSHIYAGQDLDHGIWRMGKKKCGYLLSEKSGISVTEMNAMAGMDQAHQPLRLIYQHDYHGFGVSTRKDDYQLWRFV